MPLRIGSARVASSGAGDGWYPAATLPGRAPAFLGRARSGRPVRAHLATLALVCIANLLATSAGLHGAEPCLATGCADADCADDGPADDCDDHEDGDTDEGCSPGCTAGCGCCARVSALPVTALPLLLARETRIVEYGVWVERAPTAPEPMGRDAVPRADAARS